MEFLDSALEDYILAHTSPESEILRQLHRETYMKVLQPRMLSGHLQGRVLSMLVHMMKPLNVLEIGTYTGYSALCMAEGLPEGGHIDTIDINEELILLVSKYIALSGNENRITAHIGNALDVLPQLDKKFDLVFIDADKTNYLNYYHLVFDQLPVGGHIIADNVLWSGKILDADEIKNDPDTRALAEFNEYVMNDQRVENVLFPVRDGLMIIRKKKNE